MRMMSVASLVFIAVCVTLAQAPAPQQNPPPQAVTTIQTLPFGKALRKTVGLLTVAFVQDGTTQKESGTCFFVYYPDERVGKDRGFVYLVTNRHVAQPGIEAGHPFPVVGMTVRVNRKDPAAGSDELPIPLGPALRWYFPSDDAVDLAVLPYAPDGNTYDIWPFPVSMFATRDEVAKAKIAEGNPIVFTGFFYQFPGMKKFQPIVREGVIAMMPDEMMETTLHKPGNLYLADVHVFEGNSGSPLLIDEGGIRNSQLSTGTNYKLLGVISGFYHEDANLTLTIATSYRGTIQENSGIASVVPADPLKDMLDGSDLQARRDTVAAMMNAPR